MKAEKYFEQYLKNYQNYKTYWNYEDGCVLLGAKEMYLATGKELYFSFIEKYVEPLILADGTILNYEKEKYSLDSINSGKILFFLYDKTGKEKYRSAIEKIREQLDEQPRCQCGSFVHKRIYPGQIWLDGLYMAEPFYMEYETRFHKKEKYLDIIQQFDHVQQFLFDEEKQLCVHAYDERREMFWADRETGRSQSFWLRSTGWYLMALVDTMDAMSFEIYELYRKLQDIFKQVLQGVLACQDLESGLFYQVIDRGEAEGNYTETSGSAMVAYAILKACRMGILLQEKYADLGMKILERLLDEKLAEQQDGLHLTGICQMAGLGPEDRKERDGSLSYYLSEPVVSDDAKGAGPLMMAYAQYLMLRREMNLE